MESWIIIAISAVLMIISAVSKNKKQKQGEHATGTDRGHSDQKEMSIPDIFSTIFDFSEPKEKEMENDMEEFLKTESKSFHDQFEDTTVGEVRVEPLYEKAQEEVVSGVGEISYMKFDDYEMTDKARVKKPREKIDPRKMIIYSELLKPKYKEV